MTSPCWQSFCLADVAFFQEGPGLRNWQWTFEGIKVINGTNVLLSGQVDTSNTDKFISLVEFESKYKHFEIDEGDLVLTSSGTLGKVGKIRPEHLPLMMNTSVIRFRSKNLDVLDDGYLHCYLRSPEFQAKIRSFAVGGAQQNFGPSHLKQIKLSLPSVENQRQVSATIAAYDELIENNRRRIALLEQSARLLYREWFVHLRFPGHEHVKVVNGVPEGWRVRKLEQISNELRVAINPERVSSGTPYIGLEHMPRRSITLSDWGQSDDIASQKFLYEEGDMLFGKIRPYFHKVGFTLTDGITSSDAVVIRPVEENLRYFLLLLVSSDHFVALASKTVKEGSKMPRADWKYLSKRTFAVPPDSLLVELNQICEPLVAQLKSLSSANTKSRQTRDLLLPRLMSGELQLA